MRSEYNHKFNPDLVEMNEKLRKDVMRTLENYGVRPFSELPDMTEAERSKWFFWNLHENLDNFRKLEPTLIGQIMCTQTTVSEGQSMEPNKSVMEKRLALTCKWHIRLVYSAFQNEEAHTIGEGSVDLLVSDSPPLNPSLRKNQKGYLDSDNSLYPNQLFLYGWVSEAVWDELKQHLYSPSPNCQTDILLRDNYVFPVKAGFDFVVGPPGSIGITNLEFRVSSYSGERRTSRRSETLPR
ncbi:hypothetical protein D3870_13545 [Noviherbaspirillum cavernae]|uniref:Uncharacterized protein n=1 Tax=Noviherbaspirillum cavernae TaxID=2320862 RepID=A0A418X354_9BURK|nr:hypothetical protein [Noviherbaspirillum cavernae]RJG06886.1 hypothetical protein D3870_13545 [Noviherbaspirillum cavernae]